MDIPKMKRRYFLGLAGANLVGTAFAQSSATGSTKTKVGFAEADISPEIGMEEPGGYGKVFHKSFHDACKVRVAVFDDGQKTAALVGLDSLMVPRHLVLAVRKDIQARCGIEPNAVLIGASHSHSSGPLGMVQPGEYDHASKLVQQLAYEKSSAADVKYLKKVHEQIVAAVCEAHQRRSELMLGIGSGQESGAAFNRRFRMKNGRTFTHPRPGNPDIVKVAGPIDPEVGVIGAWDAKGKLMGCVVSYACHATTSPGGISANWIHYLEKTLQGAFGEQAKVVFLQGACGDITQVDNLNQTQNPSGEEWAQLVGGRVGAEAIKVLLSMPKGQLTPVASEVEVLRIPRRVPAPERVKKALETVAKDPKEVGPANWVFAKEIVLLDALLQKEKAVDAEVQAVQIGPAVFITNPAEFFVEFGLELKAKSQFPFTFPVELANGCVGYVPTEEALNPKTGGGYETRLTSYSNLVPSAGNQMVKTGLKLAAKMKPGTVPKRPKAPAFTEPWSYGNVPAEPH
jgi:neutral ceramidase